MLLYSKPVEYSLRALFFIIKNGSEKAYSGEEIASQEDIPRHYLSKILQKMVLGKILLSIKGPGGGFKLAKNPDEIPLYDVIGVFEDVEEKLDSCAIGWEKCSDENPCALHDEYKKVKVNIRSFYESISLSKFAEVSAFKSPPPEVQ